MKKLVSVVLAMLMLVMSFGAVAESADVAGVWYLNTFAVEGVEMAASTLGLDMTMTLNEDGTALLESNASETENGTWVLNNGVVEVTDATGEMQSFTVVEDTLQAEQEGMVLVMGREKTAEDVFEPAPVVAEPAREDFNGSWYADLVTINGSQFSTALLGVSMFLDISDEGIMYVNIQDGEVSTNQLPYVFENGAINIGEGTMVLYLHEDGLMSYTEETQGMVMYFAKTAETEGETEEAAE